MFAQCSAPSARPPQVANYTAGRPSPLEALGVVHPMFVDQLSACRRPDAIANGRRHRPVSLAFPDVLRFADRLIGTGGREHHHAGIAGR